MHVDLNTLDSLPTAPRHSPVLIVGGGIAGLLLAHQLTARGLECTVLEAGGLDLEPMSQSLYEAAEMADGIHTGTTAGRFRTLGGSSTRWGGQLLPYTPDIFAPPPGAPSLSWPLDPRALEPFYPALEGLMGTDHLPFTADLLPTVGRAPVALPPALNLRFSKWAPFRRRNLAQTIGRDLLSHPGVLLYTHANAAELLPGLSRKIRGVRVVDYRGRSTIFTAERIVVATGTIESSRLLLLSPEAVPNHHDQIGRFFHDHVSLRAALFEGSARETMLDRLGPAFVDGTLHTAKLETSPDLRAREDLLAAMAHLVIEEPEDSSTAAIRNLLRSLQQGSLTQAVRASLLPALRGAPDIARLAYASRFERRRAVSRRARVHLHLDLEQPAGPDSRIALSATQDALGLPKAIVHWRIGPREHDTTHRFAHLLRAALREAAFPEPTWTTGLLEGAPLPFTDTFHPMGGLRMGTDPATSVVAPDLRVHDLDNLFIASCAVFPSGGSSNPTFTLMALTLRLAEDLSA